MTDPSVLGVDVGGTSVKARLASTGGEIFQEWRYPTPTGDPSGEETSQILVEILDKAREIRGVDALGVVVPGIVDENAGICISAVNLGWKDLPFRNNLAARINMPLAFGQDVRAGALAEVSTGAAAGNLGTVAFVAVGTGLASAISINGSIISSGGWAGEIGQVIITHGPHAGQRVEEIASASGISRALGVANAKLAADLVRHSEPNAVAIWNEAVRVLAEAIAWIAATIAPEIVIVGGGLAQVGGLLFDPLTARLSERIPYSRLPILKAAVHGEAAATVGACYLATQLILGQTES